MVQVHRFETSGDAYDASQTRDDIRDGDVLVVGIMVAAWPTAVTQKLGAFHELASDAEWSSLAAWAGEKPRDYGPSVKAAELAIAALAAA